MRIGRMPTSLHARTSTMEVSTELEYVPPLLLPPLLVKQLQLTSCLVAVAAACTQVMPQPPHVVATWADTGKVHLFRSKPIVAALNSNAALSKARKALAAGPCFTFNGHPTEGYAMDWSPCVPGRYVAA